MDEVDKLAKDYAKEQGDDCLCQRTQPGTPFGECIYIFCGCDVAAAFKAGFIAAQQVKED